ncbi:Msh6 mismatch repair muts-like protein, meiosis and mitosis [Guillardia theta CCMP2712]|uniref:DNA mismatch repair protein n=1 Tax=Guillardia theta (strain CCMP2712) TaxID=905079 RepID=L1K1Q1_GUITC|nr:Msh6 mismatch repair muts-like protein, meiosis and mitosis [Guillardia theta CCMP2712]EKX54504.1 Msh6 mismatch repair muts-like protein, meiosis and mitosis [Guillardia theta CCMP2712]|eukprot:XP_005841484.1 Msh6 mismatch repair muts-like protein, meiosis and mitosis [Guillardia theta CCMP2712]
MLRQASIKSFFTAKSDCSPSPQPDLHANSTLNASQADVAPSSKSSGCSPSQVKKCATQSSLLSPTASRRSPDTASSEAKTDKKSKKCTDALMEQGTCKHLEPLLTEGERIPPAIGCLVKVLFDEGDWYQGKITRYDRASQLWHVQFEDGDEDDVRIPSEDVMVLQQAEENAERDVPKTRRSTRSCSTKAMRVEKKYTFDPSSSESESDEKDRQTKRRRIRRVVESDNSEGEDRSYEVPQANSMEEEEDSSSDEETEAQDVRSSEAADESMEVEDSPKKKQPVVNKSQTKGSRTSSGSVGSLKSLILPASKASGKERSAPTAGSSRSKKQIDLSPSEERRLARETKFEAINQERYKWLEDVKDSSGKRPGEDGYDPRTLYIPSSAYSSFTQFERQFWDIKRENFDVVLFFKKGKFYEMFEGDADIGHKHLHLKLTDRVKMRMCGIPEGQFSTYATRLVARGFKVGRVEQMETLNAMQKRAKSNGVKQGSLVCERELCQILTQGTLVDESMLSSPQANYMLTVSVESQSSTHMGICLLEASTGYFYLGEVEDDEMRTQFETVLLKAKPKEVVYPKGCLNKICLNMIRRHLDNPILNALQPGEQFWDHQRTVTELENGSYFSSPTEDVDSSHGNSSKGLPEQLNQMVSERKESALSALGGAVCYLRSLKLDMELVSMKNFRPLQEFDGSSKSSLIIDGQTLCNLEVIENCSGGTEGTLLKFLDRCSTAFGKRKFRNWVCSPLQDVSAINLRLDAAEFFSSSSVRKEIQAKLKKLPDVERHLSRVHMHGTARKQGVMFDDTSARKLRLFLQLLESLDVVCEIAELVQGLKEDGDESGSRAAPRLPHVDFPQDLRGTLSKFKGSYGDLRKAMEDGFITPESGVYQDYDKAMDRLKGIEKFFEDELLVRPVSLYLVPSNGKSQGWKKKLGEPSLRFWHPAAGREPYQIEFPSSFFEERNKKLSNDFELKSQTSKVKRYWTDSIREKVSELVDARETLDEIRSGMSRRMQIDFDSNYNVWSQAVEACAHLDCLISLSYTCEEELRDCRHPCISAMARQTFVPNDVVLGAVACSDGFQRACVVTGPNMGGKSTLLRQTCIAVIMAQVLPPLALPPPPDRRAKMGAYVPAACCRMRPVDRIFTRIGASDRIMAGQSTFMVELSETSIILQNATSRSLVILDELGRGTSTFDGYAIAYSVLCHLVKQNRPLLLFSTHYKSITDEFRASKDVSLCHMDCLVDEGSQTVTFLYKFKRGVASDSYGLHCAKAAGLPQAVIARAQACKSSLETRGSLRGLRQLSLFKSVIELADNQELPRHLDLEELVGDVKESLG